MDRTSFIGEVKCLSEHESSEPKDHKKGIYRNYVSKLNVNVEIKKLKI